MTTDTPPSHPTESTPLRNLRTGLQVWSTEIRRMLTGMGHDFEIRQLKKRLREEYATLGRLTSDYLAEQEAASQPSNKTDVPDQTVTPGTHGTAATPGSFPDIAMLRAAKQAHFLEDEITRLRQEQQDALQRSAARRNNT